MKKTFRIFALLNISVLYCFVISLYSSNALPDSSVGSKLSKSESKNYSALPVTDLICHLAPSAILAPACVTLPSSSLKNPFNEFFAWVHWSEQAIFSTFSQYSFYSQNLLIRLEKTDIIFPFHYFW